MKVRELNNIIAKVMETCGGGELDVKIWYDSGIDAEVGVAGHLIDLKGVDNCFAILEDPADLNVIERRGYAFRSNLCIAEPNSE